MSARRGSDPHLKSSIWLELQNRPHLHTDNDDKASSCSDSAESASSSDYHSSSIDHDSGPENCDYYSPGGGSSASTSSSTHVAISQVTSSLTQSREASIEAHAYSLDEDDVSEDRLTRDIRCFQGQPFDSQSCGGLHGGVGQSQTSTRSASESSRGQSSDSGWSLCHPTFVSAPRSSSSRGRSSDSAQSRHTYFVEQVCVHSGQTLENNIQDFANKVHDLPSSSSTSPELAQVRGSPAGEGGDADEAVEGSEVEIVYLSSESQGDQGESGKDEAAEARRDGDSLRGQEWLEAALLAKRRSPLRWQDAEENLAWPPPRRPPRAPTTGGLGTVRLHAQIRFNKKKRRRKRRGASFHIESEASLAPQAEGRAPQLPAPSRTPSFRPGEEETEEEQAGSVQRHHEVEGDLSAHIETCCCCFSPR